MFVIAPSPARRRRIVEALGLGVRAAASIAEARLFFDEAPPRLLIVDLVEGAVTAEQQETLLKELPLLHILALIDGPAKIESERVIKISGAPLDLAATVTWSQALIRQRALMTEGAALAAELRGAATERADLVRRFSALIEDINEVVLEFDLGGRIIAVNPASSALIGFSPTEVCSLRLADFLAPADCDQVLAFVAQPGEESKLKRVVPLSARGGKPMLAQLTVVPIELRGRPLGGRAMLGEATSVERGSRLAQKLGSFFWSLASTLDERQLLSRFADQVESVSELPRFALYLGEGASLKLVSADEQRRALLPKDVSLPGDGCPIGLHLERGATAPYVCASADACCADGDNVDGKRCELALLVPAAVVMPLQSDGESLGLLILGGPDPEAWQSEGRLAHLSMIGQYLSMALNKSRLHRRTVDHAHALQLTLADLQLTRDRLALSEQLAAAAKIATGLSHEIRNPLNAMALMLGNLKDAIAHSGGKTAPLAAKVDPVLTEVKRLKQLLDELLVVSRPRTRKPDACDFNSILCGAVESLRPQFDQRSMRIEQRLALALPALLGHEDDLRRMLINLMINAWEAMEPGGELVLETSEVGREVICTIRDDGAGMTSEQRSSAFDVFYTTKSTGTGLGLALVQRVVADMQGKVHCRSAVGEGSEFLISLPIREAEEPSARTDR